MKPIAVFYHWMPSHYSLPIVTEAMRTMKDSGLLDAAGHFLVGINGGPEALTQANALLPLNAIRVFHGADSRSENPTIVEIEKWVPANPDWHVLYFHSKGASMPPNTANGIHSANWRRCMLRNLVLNWRRCIEDLDAGFESVGCHWVRGLDKTQNYWAGTFFWATSNFLASLPSIYNRLAIRQYGIKSLTARYESEVWIGNGPRLPKRKDYHPEFKNCA